MSWTNPYIAELKRAGVVRFRPLGRSMEPLIQSGQLVQVRQYEVGHWPQVGHIVLCKVGVSGFLHRIGAVSDSYLHSYYRIENAAGYVNGWVTNTDIHGYVDWMEQ